jgi:hypothetical protein
MYNQHPWHERQDEDCQGGDLGFQKDHTSMATVAVSITMMRGSEALLLVVRQMVTLSMRVVGKVASEGLQVSG